MKLTQLHLGKAHAAPAEGGYWGTLLIRNSAPLGTYSRTMPRVLGGSWGGGLFLMGEVPLYLDVQRCV